MSRCLPIDSTLRYSIHRQALVQSGHCGFDLVDTAFVAPEFSGSQQLATGNTREDFAHGCARDRCVVVGLTAKPPSIAEPKVPAQPQVSVRGDGSFTCHDISDSLRRHADVFGQSVLSQAKRLQELFIQHFARRNRGNSTHIQTPSVVVHDFNVLRSINSPDETHAPLIIDANAVLDRKSTRLNSSHANISYAVFCL